MSTDTNVALGKLLQELAVWQEEWDMAPGSHHDPEARVFEAFQEFCLASGWTTARPPVFCQGRLRVHGGQYVCFGLIGHDEEHGGSYLDDEGRPFRLRWDAQNVDSAREDGGSAQ